MQPAVPVAVRADAHQTAVVVVAVTFDVFGQIQQRLRQPAAFDQEQGDEQAADAAVAVEKGMDRFEMLVHQRALDQVGQFAAGVNEGFPGRQSVVHLLRRRVQPLNAEIQRGDIVADFANIVRRRVGRLAGFVGHQIAQAGAGSLDPRGQHGLAPDIRGDQQMRVGQDAAEAGQLAERGIGGRKRRTKSGMYSRTGGSGAGTKAW